MADPPATTLAALRDGGRPLAALLLLGLLVKLLSVAAALAEDPLASLPTSDSRYYLDRALGVAGRVDDPLADEPFHLPPLYPLVLAGVPFALDGDFGLLLSLQALAGAAALLGVYLLARRRASRGAALAATALVLLYGPLTFFELKLLGDSLAASLLVLLLVLADGLPGRRSLGRALLLGALTGLVCLLRPQALLLLPVLAVWAFRLRPRAGWALAAAALATIAPATLHNLRVSGDLILVSDNGGVNLWIANTGPVSATFVMHDPEFGDIDRQATTARRRAEAAEGRALSPGEVSRFFARRALAEIAADPLTFGRRLLARGRALLESFEAGVVAIPAVEGRLVAPLRVLALPFGVLAALASAGLVLATGRRARGHAPASAARSSTAVASPAPWVPLAAVAGLVVVTTLLFYQYSRFRLPIVPVLAVLVAVGIDRARARPGLLRATLAVLAALAVGAASFLPAEHHGKVLANGWTSLAEARLATAASPADTQAFEAALADAERALRADDGFVRALQQAADASFLLQRYDATHGYLAAIERVLPTFVPALMTRAWLSLRADPRNRHRDPARARAAYEQLLLQAATDPTLAPHVAALEAALRGAGILDG